MSTLNCFQGVRTRNTIIMCTSIIFFGPLKLITTRSCISTNVKQADKQAVEIPVVFDSFLICVTEATKEEEEEENKESSEDLLRTGHLTQLLEANLAAEVEALCVGDVVGGLQRLLIHLRSLCDSGQPLQLQVPAAAAAHHICCSKAVFTACNTLQK